MTDQNGQLDPYDYERTPGDIARIDELEIEGADRQDDKPVTAQRMHLTDEEAQAIVDAGG